jgi:hemerythrin
MRYELTQDLLTGNQLIDSEHRQLFDAINALMDACAQGAGRTKISETVQFLNSYVSKHFRDEEQLQLQSKYPGYNAHHTFHEGYKRELAAAANQIGAEVTDEVKAKFGIE